MAGPGDDGVAGAERPPLHQDGGHRASAPVQVGLDHHSPGGRGRIGLQLLELRHQQDGLEQLIEVLTGLRGDVDELVGVAPLGRNQLVLHQLLADTLRIRLRLVDLVDRHHDGHAGGPGVVQGLEGLRHHPVVGRDHQDHDVGDLRSAGPHGGEGLVARRVDERDLTPVVVNLVGPDVLGDPSELLGHHVGLADGVEEERLAVVDVSHHGHDGRPGDEPALVDLFLFALLIFLDPRDLGLVAQLAGQLLEGLVGERLRGRHHLAQPEQDLHHFGGGATGLLRDVLRRGPSSQLQRGENRGLSFGLIRFRLRDGGHLAVARSSCRPGRWHRLLHLGLGTPLRQRLHRRGLGLRPGNGLPSGCPQPGYRFLGHGRRGGPPAQSHLLERRQDVLARDAELLCKLVDSHREVAALKCMSNVPASSADRAVRNALARAPRFTAAFQHPSSAWR